MWWGLNSIDYDDGTFKGQLNVFKEILLAQFEIHRCQWSLIKSTNSSTTVCLTCSPSKPDYKSDTATKKVQIQRPIHVHEITREDWFSCYWSGLTKEALSGIVLANGIPRGATASEIKDTFCQSSTDSFPFMLWKWIAHCWFNFSFLPHCFHWWLQKTKAALH